MCDEESITADNKAIIFVSVWGQRVHLRQVAYQETCRNLFVKTVTTCFYQLFDGIERFGPTSLKFILGQDLITYLSLFRLNETNRDGRNADSISVTADE